MFGQAPPRVAPASRAGARRARATTPRPRTAGGAEGASRAGTRIGRPASTGRRRSARGPRRAAPTRTAARRARTPGGLLRGLRLGGVDLRDPLLGGLRAGARPRRRREPVDEIAAADPARSPAVLRAHQGEVVLDLVGEHGFVQRELRDDRRGRVGIGVELRVRDAGEGGPRGPRRGVDPGGDRVPCRPSGLAADEQDPEQRQRDRREAAGLGSHLRSVPPKRAQRGRALPCTEAA